MAGNATADTTSIVEVGMMGVQADKTPVDASMPGGAILLDAWKSIITAPGGPERIIWALEKGDESRIWGWFEWENLRAHEEFAASFGGTATQRFGEVFTPGFTKHAFHSTAPLRSPITQVLTAFFPATITQGAKDGVAASFEHARTAVVEERSGVKAVSAGWGLESDFPVRGRGGKGKREKGTVFFVLVGWEGVDEMEMEKAREDVALLAERGDCVAWDEFLVECEVLERVGKGE